MRLVLAGIAALAIATPIVAQQAPGSKNPAAVTGGAYTADAHHSFVVWTVDHLGFTPLSGMFGEISGTLQLDPKNPGAAKVDVTIPVSRLAVGSERFKGHLLSPGKDGGKPDFFGPSPADARFVSTGVTVSGQTAKIAGDLTLNGVTRPVTLDAEFYGAGKTPAQMGGKENVGFTAKGAIKRSDFGLGFGTQFGVSDEVKLKIAAGFQK